MWRWIPLLLMALVLPVLGLLLLALFLWWLLSRRDREAEQRAFEIEIEAIPVESEAYEADLDLPIGDVETAELDVDLHEAEVALAQRGVEIPDSEVAEPPAESEAPEPPTPDDLKQIEGIGPKISQVLGEAGITTFAQLAASEVEQLRQILEAADPRLVRLADPTSWPEQARLAATGSTEALDALKDTLKGGRRID